MTTTLAIEAPVLDAYRDDEGWLHVWCPHELCWHRHGFGCSCTWQICACPREAFLAGGRGCTCGRLAVYGICTCPTGADDGYRGALCVCRASPYFGGGYYLREVGELTHEVLARHVGPAPGRYCEWDVCAHFLASVAADASSPMQLPPPQVPTAVAHALRRGFTDPFSERWMYRSPSGLPLGWPLGDGCKHSNDDPGALPAWRYHDCHLHNPVTRLEDAQPTLRRWRGTWVVWRGDRWGELETEALTAVLRPRLDGATYLKDTPAGDTVEVPWNPTKARLGEVTAALGDQLQLDGDVDKPAWLGRPRASGPVVAARNGLLDVTTGELLPHGPDYFNGVSVPFDYDPAAPGPSNWLTFLTQLWPTDPSSIAVLQEWAGYVLSGRTDLQKILLLTGPPRSGKGTVARVLTQLVGRGHVAGPTLASLLENFGLADLVEKPLGIIADARLGGRDGHKVVERLLSISGEDTLTVDRKFRDAWVGRLPTRLMLMSNELPSLGDASGAIASRFLPLTLEQSWLGREDIDLERKLVGELTGILNWALVGLQRLTSQGRFSVPQHAAETLLELHDAASPVSAFLRERCLLGPGHEVPAAQLFAAWQGWCLDNGRDRPGTQQRFGRDLRASVPALKLHRPRLADGTQARIYQGIALNPEVSRAESRLNPYTRANFPTPPQLPQQGVTHE